MIRGRGDNHLVPLGAERLADAERLGHGLPTDLLIKPLRKKGLKLQPQQTTLGQECTVLLDKRKEVRKSLRVAHNDRLAKQGTDLRTTYIKYIGQRGKLLERKVVPFGRQGIAQARTVDVERNLGLATHRGEGLQLGLRVGRAVLRRL